MKTIVVRKITLDKLSTNESLYKMYKVYFNNMATILFQTMGFTHYCTLVYDGSEVNRNWDFHYRLL